MTIALIGSDIPGLIPGLLADMFYANKAEGSFKLFEPNPALGELLENYANAVIEKSGIRGRFIICHDLETALEGADAVLFSDSLQCASRFQMDVSALGGENDEDEGLKNQARLHDGVEGLLFTLRQGAKALTLVEAMRKKCPDATVLNLSEPLSQITALFCLCGFTCYGFGESPDITALCKQMNKIPSTVTFETEGLYRFQFLTALQSGKDLMPEAARLYKQGAMGDEKKLYFSWYDALPIGEGHGESLPQNDYFTPDLNPVLSEPIERRKERMLRMNEVVTHGLSSAHGQLAQLSLIKNVSAIRPVQFLLRGEGNVLKMQDGLVIQGAIDNLPQAALDTALEVANGHLLSAKAAMGDREALRGYIETAPAFAGLDRLYLQSLIESMLSLHGDILPLFSE
jgi:Alpha-galactosidases/6-phospho-beta-glucosidases, family 4 of glycosyl hydrolases